MNIKPTIVVVALVLLVAQRLGHADDRRGDWAQRPGDVLSGPYGPLPLAGPQPGSYDQVVPLPPTNWEGTQPLPVVQASYNPGAGTGAYQLASVCPLGPDARPDCPDPCYAAPGHCCRSGPCCETACCGGCGCGCPWACPTHACRCGLMVYGRAMASFLAGRFQAEYLQSESFDPTVVDTAWKADRIVTILDLELGAGWESPCKRYRFTAGYVMSGWFNAVKTDEWIAALQSNDYGALGDTLTFEGLTARAEFRF